MSSFDEDEGSVSRVGFEPESGQQAGTLGCASGSGQNREGKGAGEGQGQGQLPDPDGFVGNQQVKEAAEQVPQGCGGRTASLATLEGASAVPLGDGAAMAIPRWLAHRDAWGFLRSPFPESSNRGVSTLWMDPEPGPRGRGALGWVGSQISPRVSFYFRGPEGGFSWGSPKQGAGSRSKASVGGQRALEEGLDSWPWSDSASSQGFVEMQLMRASTCQKGGGWAEPKSLEGTGSLCRSPVREKGPPKPGPCLALAPREAGQAVRDLEASSKKPHRDSRGKPGSRPSYLPLVAAPGGLPEATPGWKAAQDKRSLEGALKAVWECFFHLLGQRDSGTPRDPAAFCQISGVALLGSGTSRALTPVGTRESKPSGAGQESVAQRKRGSEPVVGEGDGEEPSRDPLPESGTTSLPCGCDGQCNAGALKDRHTQDRAPLEPLALSEEQVLASGPAPPSDLDPPEQLPGPDRLQQAPGAEACARCEELQRGIHALGQQVATMQTLLDKLQRL